MFRASHFLQLNSPHQESWELKCEKAEELKAKLKQKEEELNRLYNTAPKDMWLTDLDALVAAYKVCS